MVVLFYVQKGWRRGDLSPLQQFFQCVVFDALDEILGVLVFATDGGKAAVVFVSRKAVILALEHSPRFELISHSNISVEISVIGEVLMHRRVLQTLLVEAF